MKLNRSATREFMNLERWTVTRLADELDINRSWLNHIVLGTRRCPAEVLIGIAEKLGVEPFALIGPSNPRAAAMELCEVLGIEPEDLEEHYEARTPHGDEVPA